MMTNISRARSSAKPDRSGDSLWLKAGEGQSYEAYVAGILTCRFPGTRIRRNVRVTGIKSGVPRQIDVVIECGGVIAVDCKSYSRKVDIKHVESCLAMLDDLGVRSGIVVTTKGYTSGALKRVQNDLRQLDLQILPPDRLSDYQHIGAPLIWRGSLGISLDCPPGWVADNEFTHAPGGCLVAMYPLGHTFQTASRLAPFIYANILSKLGPSLDIASTAAPHQAATLEDQPLSTFETEFLSLTDSRGIQRDALLRTARIGPSAYGLEHCLYVDYDDYVLLLALWSPPEECGVLVPILLNLVTTSFVMKVTDRSREIGVGAD